MLQVTLEPVEMFNDETQEFFTVGKHQVLQLEHSLVSLSKWESIYCKPFLTNDSKTREESIDYIRCMTITKDVDPEVFNYIPDDVMNKVIAYIQAPMTATTFSKDENHKINRDIITSEIIYYWMVALTIPFECQKWHLNRLLTLINVCNIKNQPKKKMPKSEILAHNRAVNAARRNALNSSG